MMLRCFCIGVLTLLTMSGVSAQTATTGQIAGTVTDPSGAVISGATLKLDSQAGIHRESATGENGGYVLNLLSPGHYSLQATAPGFQSGTAKDIEVKITNRSQ